MRLLTGYAKPIIALAVSPDGGRLYSAAKGQTLMWQWDLAVGELVRKIKCPFASRGVSALAASKRGDCFALAGEGYGVAFWRDGEEPRQLDTRHSRQEGTSYNPGLAIHPRRRLVAVSFARGGNGYGYQTWDADDDDKHVIRTGHDRLVDALTFSPDGTVVATASQDGTVRLWPLAGGDALHVLRPRVGPTGVAYRPDGKQLAVCGMRSLFVFDATTGEHLGELKGAKGNVQALAYSPDGKHLASVALDGFVVLRDAKSLEVVGQRSLDMGKLTALVWRADSSGLIVGGEKLIADCDLADVMGTAHAVPRGEPLSLEFFASRVDGLTYSPDGRLLGAWGKWTNLWRFWDMSGGAGRAKRIEREESYRLGSPDSVTWSPDSKRMALAFAGHRTGVQWLGDVETGQQTTHFSISGHNCTHLAFAPGGRLLLCVAPVSPHARWTRLELRDGETTMQSRRFETETYDVSVTRSAFSPDEKRIYVACATSVYRWTPEDDAVARLFVQQARITGFAVRGDERLALTTGGNTAHLWSLPDGKKRAELKHPLACSAAAFLPGERVITACFDGVVRLWDATGGAEMLALELGMGKIHCLVVSPDGMTFAAGVEKKHRVVLMDVPE